MIHIVAVVVGCHVLSLSVLAQAAPPKAQEPPKLWQDFCCFEKGRTERDGLVTVVYDLSHTPGAAPNIQGLEEFQKLLAPFLTAGKGRVDVSNRLSALTLTDTKENIAFVERMLHLLHSPDQPIMIEARVVELRWDKDLQIGIQGDLNNLAGVWTQPAGSEALLQEVRTRLNPTAALGLTPFQGSTFRFARSSGQQGSIGALVQTFLERGKAQILSQPRVLVRADQTATLFSGDDVPYPASITLQPVTGNVTTYAYKNAGVKLMVTPHVAAPGQVSLKLNPEVTSIFGYVEITPGTQAPQFTVRSVNTELLVRDGQEVVIGGLYRRDKSTIRRGLPFLMDIPVFGYLFGRYEEAEVIQEVLFFIKPTVIRSEREMPRGGFVPDK
jgi:type II secretory pathway component GspD/PulD (secretin)